MDTLGQCNLREERMKKTMSLRVPFTIANAFKSPMKGKGQKKAMGGGGNLYNWNKQMSRVPEN